jgi:hypothetical protein
LHMVNSVLSSLPTFFMCSIKVPIEILKQIDKYRKHCLWRGGEIERKKPPLAAWDLVTRPKMKGGLSVIHLRLENNALLMKNLHKFFNKADLPWVKLLWSKYYSNGKVSGTTKKGRGLVEKCNQFAQCLQRNRPCNCGKGRLSSVLDRYVE